jgi:hypothetical protein
MSPGEGKGKLAVAKFEWETVAPFVSTLPCAFAPSNWVVIIPWLLASEPGEFWDWSRPSNCGRIRRVWLLFTERIRNAVA